MKLVNRTKGTTLATRVKFCRTFWSKALGLMFRRSIGPDEAFVFVNSQSGRVQAAIHMFFVFFPIAVVWLDEDRRVVDKTLAQPFHPWYAPSRPALCYVEGHPELLEKVDIGDELVFQEDDQVPAGCALGLDMDVFPFRRRSGSGAGLYLYGKSG